MSKNLGLSIWGGGWTKIGSWIKVLSYTVESWYNTLVSKIVLWLIFRWSGGICTHSKICLHGHCSFARGYALSLRSRTTTADLRSWSSAKVHHACRGNSEMALWLENLGWKIFVWLYFVTQIVKWYSWQAGLRRIIKSYVFTAKPVSRF